MGNNQSMNTLFGKSVVKQSRPDNFWPLPTELIGIEIETENFRRWEEASDTLSHYWTTHNDASLRGGIEWVLASPLAGSDLREAINQFFDGEYTYTMSERTSTHIHINASDNLTVDQFRNVFVLMYLIEPAVFRWADENRKWCGYCQPLTDMSPQRLASVMLDEDGFHTFVRAVSGEGNSDRYYGLNIAAFNRHGTLEFRYFPCVDNKDVLIDWIKFVMQVKRAAIAADNPLEILSNFDTHEGIEAYLTKWFDDNAPVIQRGLDYSDVVRRSVELQALITSKLADIVNGPAYRQTDAMSKALSKLLTKKFGGTGTSPRTRRTGTAATAARQTSYTEVWDTIRASNAGTVSFTSSSERAAELVRLYNQISGGAFTTNTTR